MKAFFNLVLTGLAGMLSLQTLAATPPALAPRVTEIIASRCALCHGPQGESASAIYPRLAAQHPDYISKQLKDFRDGRRKSDTMTEMAKDLQDDDIAGLAAFFSGRKAGGRQPGDVDLAAVASIFTSAATTFPEWRPAPRAMVRMASAPSNCRVWRGSIRLTSKSS